MQIRNCLIHWGVLKFKGKRYFTLPWIVFAFLRLIGGIYYIFHIWNEDYGSWYFFFCICAAIYFYGKKKLCNPHGHFHYLIFLLQFGPYTPCTWLLLHSGPDHQLVHRATKSPWILRLSFILDFWDNAALIHRFMWNIFIAPYSESKIIIISLIV